MCIFGRLVHIFGELVHILWELVHILGELVQIFAWKLVSRTSKISFEKLGSITATGGFTVILTQNPFEWLQDGPLKIASK